MAGPKVQIKLSNRGAAKNLLEFETKVRASAGDLTVGINPRRRYYRGRRKPVSIIRVAAWNEFGVPAKGGEGWKVPPRPAITTALAQNRKRYLNSLEARLGIQLSKKRTTKKSLGQTMEDLGRMIVADIRASILGWTDPRNADSTIARKGFDDPLVESKKLANAFEAKWTPGDVPASNAVRRAAKSLAAFKGNVGAK